MICIYSPSKPATVTAKARYERGKKRLEALGLIIREGSLTGKDDFYRSGTPKERAQEFNALLRDPQVKMILPTMGGTNANSMLPYLDYQAFRQNPKMLVGLSDVTAILLGMYAKTEIPVFFTVLLLLQHSVNFRHLCNIRNNILKIYLCILYPFPTICQCHQFGQMTD